MSFVDLLRRLRKPHVEAGRPRSVRQYQYHAVAIRPDVTACPAALAARGKRFLSREAPRLPLPDCSQPQTCRCKFVHFNDRRQEERRDILSFSRWYSGTEKRRGPGRRSSDH